MDVTLRSAIPADAAAVAEVYLASRKRFLPYAPLVHSDDDVRRWVREHVIPKTDAIVAVADGRIVGMMALVRHESAGEIDALYLAPEAVGRGIGSRLMELAKAKLGSPIRLYAFQANAEARRFYERHGFTAIEFGDGSGNEEHCPDVLYEWRDTQTPGVSETPGV